MTREPTSASNDAKRMDVCVGPRQISREYAWSEGCTKKKKIKVSEPGDVTIEFLTNNYNYIKTSTCAKYYDELVH